MQEPGEGVIERPRLCKKQKLKIEGKNKKTAFAKEFL